MPAAAQVRARHGAVNVVRALLLGLAALAIVAGCNQSEQPQTGTSTHDPGDCKGGDTAPFSVEELLDGLRAAGYDMYVDPGCSDESASWALSNTSIDVPELGPEDFGRAQAREGAISCKLFDAPEGQGATVTVTHFEGEDWTTLHTLNVSCTITPDPAKQTEQIEKLEQTLNELAARN